MQIWTAQIANPMLRTVLSRGADHVRARGHAGPKLIRERRERWHFNAHCSQAIPGECDRDPARIRLTGSHGFRVPDFIQHR